MLAKPTTLLLTGATGVVGLAVAHKLLQEGYTLRALVRNTKAAAALLPPSITLIEGSVQDHATLQEALQGCHACVHLAGVVQFADTYQQELLATNYGGTANVVNACLATESLQHLVHFGSVAAIPLAQADLQTVPHPSHYSSYYGYTKRLSELEVHRGGAEGLGFTILQPSVVLAVHPQVRSSTAVLRIAKRPSTYCPPGMLHWVAGADVALAVAQTLAHGPEGKTFILDATPTTWYQFFVQYRKSLGMPAGGITTLPAWVVRMAGYLAPIATAVTHLPIPSKKQLLNMLRPHTYGGQAEAETLLEQPFSSLDMALAALVAARP